jgi:hypothetical protein
MGSDLNDSLFDVRDGICRIALRKDYLIPAILGDAARVTGVGKKRSGIEE